MVEKVDKIIENDKIVAKRCLDCGEMLPIHEFDGNGICSSCYGIIPKNIKDDEELNKILMLQGRKKCPRCKGVKTFDEYHTDNNSKFGISSKCAECRNELERMARIGIKTAAGIEKQNIIDTHDILFERGLRKCYICGHVKILDDFGIDNNNPKHGRRPDCKKCRNLILVAKVNGVLGYVKDNISELTLLPMSVTHIIRDIKDKKLFGGQTCIDR